MPKYSEFSEDLNGLWPDILSQYGIEIPKMTGQNSVNHPCPLCGGHDRAHWRDVGGRLALYCRGCAPDTMHSVEHVIMEYAGIGFAELTQDLADYINHVPIERINEAKVKIKTPPKTSLPISHREDSEAARELLAKCEVKRQYCIDFHRYDRGFCLPIVTWHGELVNAVNFMVGQPMSYAAGGVSFGAFTPIKVNEGARWLVVTSFAHGRFLAHEKHLNVAVCWQTHNLKYVIWNKPGDIQALPVLTPDDDDYLLYEMNCGWFENYRLKKVNKKDI